MCILMYVWYKYYWKVVMYSEFSMYKKFFVYESWFDGNIGGLLVICKYVVVVSVGIWKNINVNIILLWVMIFNSFWIEGNEYGKFRNKFLSSLLKIKFDFF